MTPTNDNPMLGTRIHDIERRLTRLEAQCPTHTNELKPSQTQTTTPASALTEPQPASWPLPPRPEKSAAREPGQRGGDGSCAGSGGTSGSSVTTAERSLSSPMDSSPTKSSASTAGDASTVPSAASSAPAADPVGVPEWLTVGIEPPIIGDKRIVVMPFPGVQRGVRLWSDSDALHLVNIVNAGIRALRQHHERVVASLRERCERAERALTEPERWKKDKDVFFAITAERERARPPQGCVRLPDGRDVKVLGTLPLTKDGCVVGNHAELWIWDCEPIKLRADNIGATDVHGDDAFYEAGECYSTRAAAKSARGGGGE